MKKALLLCGMLIALLLPAGCSSGGGGTYTEPTEVELRYVGLLNGSIGPFIHNTGEKTIKDITFVIRAYDKNGTPIDTIAYHSKPYTECLYESINLISGEYWNPPPERYSTLHTQNDEAIAYVEGAISAVKFTDGSTWECESIDAWVKQADEDFSVEERKNEISQMKDLADKAFENPYMTVSTVVDGKDGSMDLAYRITSKDIGDLVIKDFTLKTLFWDKNGYSVDFSYGELAENCVEDILEDANLKANGRGTINKNIFTGQYSDIKTAMSIVSKIEFRNGDTWTNPYELYWQLYYGEIEGK